jgi:hypothetical protein
MRWLFLLLVSVMPLVAEEQPGDIAGRASLANINAVVVFTSKDGLNSGYYDFTRANASMAVVHVSDRYQFSPFREHFNFFVSGGVGYSETWMTNEITVSPVDESGETYLTLSNLLQTYTGVLGGGIRYTDETGIEWSGGMELIYSRVRFKNRSDNEFGDIVDDFFEGQYNDNLTYRFFLLAEYDMHYRGFEPYLKFSYNLYETKSGFSIDELGRFSTQSGVTSFAVGAESPALYRSGPEYLTLEAYLWGSYLGGDLPKVTGFDGYGTLGATAYWYVPERWRFIRRFFADISTIQADGLHGYNVGVGFSIDY